MKYGNIPALSQKQFLETTLVLIIAELVEALCGVIDGVFVGNCLGEEAMAAHGLSMPIFVVFCIFSNTLNAGFQQPCAVYIGKGEREHVCGLFTATMLLTLCGGALFAVSGLLFTHPVAQLMGVPQCGPITVMAEDYLQAILFGAPLLLLFLSLVPVLQMDGRRNLVYLGSLVMGVTNVAFDFLSVKVFHGGMWGIGLATTASYAMGLLVLFAYFLKKDRMFRLRLRAVRDSRPQDILTAGLPTVIRVLTHLAGLIGLNRLVLEMAGTTAMAAFAVRQSLATMLLSVGIGVSGATMLFSSISYGEQDRRGLIDVVRMSVYSCVGIVGMLAIAVFAFAKPLVAQYLSPGDASFDMAVLAVRYLAVSMPLVAWARSLGYYEQGVEQKVKATWMFMGQELLAVLPCAFFMGKAWGAEGIFASFVVSQLVVILLVHLHVFLHRDRHFGGIEAYIDVPTSFGVPPRNRLVQTLQRKDEVWQLSARAMTFCVDRGLSQAKAYLVSMYIEEMGNIIMLYGFADGKRHHLEVRLALSRDKVILRFRDDCRRFDITERASHWQEDPEHPETSIGVRMVMHAGGLLRYDNSLSTNNLIIQI